MSLSVCIDCAEMEILCLVQLGLKSCIKFIMQLLDCPQFLNFDLKGVTTIFRLRAIL